MGQIEDFVTSDRVYRAAFCKCDNCADMVKFVTQLMQEQALAHLDPEIVAGFFAGRA